MARRLCDEKACARKDGEACARKDGEACTQRCRNVHHDTLGSGLRLRKLPRLEIRYSDLLRS